MLVIEVEFLAGRYVATAHDDRNRAEWPPHPARLFSALVAALYEGGQDDDARSAERAVLVQLEEGGAPEIEASNVAGDDAVPRRTVNEVYVPVNDPAVIDHGKIEAALDDIGAADASAEAAMTPRDRSKAATQRTKAENRLRGLVGPLDVASDTDIKKAVSLQPATRVRQKRTFPSVTPDAANVRFAWSRLDLPEPARATLAGLLGRVTRLGHSSSLVRCALLEAADPTLRPVDDGPADHTLRVAGPGQLRRLDDAFNVHRAVRPRVLPFRSQRYRVVEDQQDADVVSSVFDSDDAHWIVLRAEGSSRFQSSRCVDLAKALHRGLLAHSPTQPPPELVSGRADEGRPSEQPHLAVVPLPDVGHEYAHGGILGIALILPRGGDRRPVVETIASWEASAHGPPVDAPLLTLTLGRRGVLDLRRDEIRDLWGLRAWAWARPSARWVTATPIALDANPGNLHPRGGEPADRAERARRADERAREIVAAACRRIGLPTPTDVRLSLAPMIAGSQPVRAFDPFPREAGRIRRMRVHAEITFPSKVRGPVLLGAGRYFGLGLCRPIDGSRR